MSLPPYRPCTPLADRPRTAARSRRAAALAGLALLAPALAAYGAPTVIESSGARIEVELDGSEFSAGIPVLTAWLQRGVRTVAGYYGAFPVARLELRVEPVAGSGVRGGHTDPTTPPSMRVSVGRDVTDAQFLEDWVLVHELTHLALPEVGREHAWLAEGLATYVEGIARAQDGNLAPQRLWQEDVRDMPKGLPAAGDAGLDRTHTWARTYWGGALFCLLADVTIRERTGNRRGLQDALRAIARDSGGMTVAWPIERVLRTGDAATGTGVLEELYATMGRSAAAPDLAALWRRLAIGLEGGRVVLETGTPAAELREAITRSPDRPGLGATR